MPAKLDRCVEAVKRQGGARNAFAICRAELGTDAEIRASEKRKKKRSATDTIMGE